MPVQFLSESDHERLNRFPEDITQEDLDRFFWLSQDDRQAIMGLRGAHNRLGLALLLCCLRYLGFFPETLREIPKGVVQYIAVQLQVSPDALSLYGKRSSTQRNHQRQVQILLGYRRASPIDLLALEQWLLERALEHDKPMLLFEMACQHLQHNKIVRIGTTRLAKMVSAARQQAQEAIYQTLQPLLSPDGFNWRYYELAVLWVLRQQLRSGDIYVTHSRRFSTLESYFIPKEEWQVQQEGTTRLMGTPINAQVRLSERSAELMRLIEQVELLLNDAEGELREEKGKLILSPLEAEDRSAKLEQLTSTITTRLPRLDLTDLLVEVDSWTHFSDAFEHLQSTHRRDTKLLLHLYSCLLAQACNLDLQQMAISASLGYRHLSWCNTWYIRDDTLREANTALVDYHYQLPLSHLWGGGMLSSSDGQRFPVRGSVRQARALPRYFGDGKGITFYSWTSDQFSQYGSKPIPTTIRDATYVLDEILNNETELPILEHTTDTAGYTELIFALFDLLGLQFSPRIRDLADQQLYRTSQIQLNSYPKLKSYLQGVINTERILTHWDEMLRLAGSLKMGWVTASLIVQKLQAFPRQHPLTRALQEYGRLIKTIHILRWYADETNRRRINRQLNKGEALHSLRSHLCYANQGEIRGQSDEQLRHQVGCLNLVTNAIIVWNTVYIEKVVQQLQQEGRVLNGEDLMHIWPTRYAHVNVYGRYHFELEHVGKKRPFRSIHPSGFQA